MDKALEQIALAMKRIRYEMQGDPVSRRAMQNDLLCQLCEWLGDAAGWDVEDILDDYRAELSNVD